MAFEMAGWQEAPNLGCPGGIPFSNLAENGERNTVTTAPAAELATQLYRLTGNAEYLRFAEKAYTWVRTCLLDPGGAVRGPRRPPRRGRTDALELQPGQHDRGRDAALPGDPQRRLPLPGPPDRARPRWPLHAPAAGRRNPVLRLGLLPQPAVPRLGHPRPAGAARSRRPTSTTPGPTCACRTTSSWPAPRRAPSCSCRAPSCRSTRCCPSPPSTYF